MMDFELEPPLEGAVVTGDVYWWHGTYTKVRVTVTRVEVDDDAVTHVRVRGPRGERWYPEAEVRARCTRALVQRDAVRPTRPEDERPVMWGQRGARDDEDD